MNQQNFNYQRVAKAIEFIHENFKQQPGLEEIAAYVELSPYHFQRLFSDWAGVSPKRFLQFISVKHAMSVLKDEQTSLLDVAYDTGLSGSGRLHDLFIKIEGMTPGEFKNGGENLIINYSYSTSPFGEILTASTTKGLCFMGFVDDDKTKIFNQLLGRYSKATFKRQSDAIQQSVQSFYHQDWSELPQLKLHLKATNFQLKVWETLLKIPTAKLSTYGNIAKSIKSPKASRAVATAIGNNPVAYLIPCHRVIRGNGDSGDYMWGPSRKSAIIAWEAAQFDKINKSI